MVETMTLDLTTLHLNEGAHTDRTEGGVLAWHFVGDTLRGGLPVPADGERLRHYGPVLMCISGLHASRRLIDALRYAPGSTICRVQLFGVADEEADKLVARERTILWRVDGEPILREFARMCALDVMDLWNMPEVVLDYLLTGDEGVRDAAAVAARAVWGAEARDAAWAAVRAAVKAEARAAAWDAMRAAVRRAAATGSAETVRDVVRTAAWDFYDRRLVRMCEEARLLDSMVSPGEGDRNAR